MFGPATDGGFWLFGLNKTARTKSPFGRVRWSGPHAMADVKANLSAEARVAELPTLIDLDEAGRLAQLDPRTSKSVRVKIGTCPDKFYV